MGVLFRCRCSIGWENKYLHVVYIDVMRLECLNIGRVIYDEDLMEVYIVYCPLIEPLLSLAPAARR